MPARRSKTAESTQALPALGPAIRRLIRAAVRLEEQALTHAPVTRAQALVLMSIGDMGQPAMSMLARSLQLAPSTLTRLVDPLVDQGLVKRQPSPDDRRVVVVALTAAGRKALKRVDNELDGAYGRLAGLGPSIDQPKTVKVLHALIEAFERGHLTG